MRIRDLTLQSAQLDAQQHFYSNVLGLPVIERTPLLVRFQAGWTRLTFELTTGLFLHRYHIAFNIPEHQFDAAQLWLQERVSLLARAGAPHQTTFDFRDWNAHAQYFRDGEGNVLEFIARHNLRHPTDRPFDSRSIQNVSEVGLAAPSVIDLVSAIQETTGLEIWRGRGSDTFTAVGDEEGLLIVVTQGRNWLPTDDTPAYPLPVYIEAAGMNGDFGIPGLPYIFKAVSDV